MNNKQELSLQEIQQGSFAVLLKIKEICETEGIDFFLIYGTLLGAARHKGFIPWDDDVDIGMTRSNYERFISYCINHKDDLVPFQLHHYKTNPNYIYGIARFSDSRYSINYDNTVDYGLGLFVDIYPFDIVNEDDKKWLSRQKAIFNIIAISGTISIEEKNKIKKHFFNLIRFFVMKLIGIKKVLKYNDKLAQKYNNSTFSTISCPAWIGYVPFDKSSFLNLTYITFNGVEMPVPSNYHVILKKSYGDYMKMPPENERIGHHFYKAFKK